MPDIVEDLECWCRDEYQQLELRMPFVSSSAAFDSLELPRVTNRGNVNMLAIIDVYYIFHRVREIRRLLNELYNHWESDWDNEVAVLNRVEYLRAGIQAVNMSRVYGEQREAKQREESLVHSKMAAKAANVLKETAKIVKEQLAGEDILFDPDKFSVSFGEMQSQDEPRAVRDSDDDDSGDDDDNDDFF